MKFHKKTFPEPEPGLTFLRENIVTLFRIQGEKSWNYHALQGEPFREKLRMENAYHLIGVECSLLTKHG